MSEKQAAPSISLTAEQLQDMFRAVIQEARRPADPTEEQKAAIESDKKMRADQGALALKQVADQKWNRKHCGHVQPNGTAAVAQLYDMNALICVHCQAMIKPAPGPYDENDRYIYDENLYYSLLNRIPKTTF